MRKLLIATVTLATCLPFCVLGQMDVTATDVRISVKCEGSVGLWGSTVNVELLSPIDVTDKLTALKLLKLGAEESLRKCPGAGISNLIVYVWKTGAVGNGDSYEVRGRNYEKDKLTWFEYSNPPANRKQAKERDEEIAKRQAAAEERARNAKQAAEEQRVAALRDKKALQQKFVADNRVETFATSQQLAANPFPYKGKVVGVGVAFSQMIGDGEGAFGNLVVQGLPNTLFTRQGTEAFLAIRVDGLKKLKMLGGEISVPYGSYVGSYICKRSGCSEFVE